MVVWICYIGILTARIYREYIRKRCLDRCHVNFSFKNKGKMGFWWHGLQKYAILLRNRLPGWSLQHFETFFETPWNILKHFETFLCFTWNIVLLHLQHLWKTLWKMWETFYKIISKKLSKTTWQLSPHMIYYSYSQTKH